jgi:hypothetical protein
MRLVARVVEVQPPAHGHALQPDTVAWPAESRPTRLEAAAGWLEANALFLAGLAAIAVTSLALIPAYLNQDGWLALVAGRFVASHGIPHHDTLNILTQGRSWIDQQWLSQLAMYELDRIGGLALYCLAYVALAVAALGMAIAAGRALGGTERHVLFVLPLAAFLYFAGALQIRTQGFAYPLFVATLWLLAEAARRPGNRRVYAVLPLLILWGNLHGSATLGAGIAVLYGVTLLLDDIRAGGARRPWRRMRGRTVAFLFGPPLCLCVTPYGAGVVNYYHETLLNSTFSKVVTEWQPVTSVAFLAIPFFVLMFTVIWLLGRSGARTHLFEQMTLLVLAAGAIVAVRNDTWFALAVLMLLPSVVSGVLRPAKTPERRRGVNLILAGLSSLILVSATIAVALQPASWFEREYDQRVVKTVAAEVARPPGTRVFADLRYSDWLLWKNPALANHLAYDARLELLTNAQILALAHLSEVRQPHQLDVTAGYGLLVLDPNDQPNTRILLARPATRVILRGKRVVVATSSGG